MTNEEAIERMGWIVKSYEYTKADINALEIGIAAIEKQIPKKPGIKEFPDEDEESGDKYLWNFYVCPVCGSHVGVKYNNFCSDCGQALEWRDAE